MPAFKATDPGVCAVCDEPYDVGVRITAYGEEYAHVTCYTRPYPFPPESQKADPKKARILSGETFRARGSNGWRRGKSPGSGRGSRY